MSDGVTRWQKRRTMNDSKRFADLEDIADEIVVDHAHARALVGIGHDETFALQAPQRLAHRVGAHPVASRQILGLQPGAGRQHSGDDVPAKLVGDTMRQAGFLGHFA